MATVAKGADCFHSYTRCFSPLCLLLYGLNFSESETPLIHLKKHRDSCGVIKPPRHGTCHNDAGSRRDTFTLLATTSGSRDPTP